MFLPGPFSNDPPTGKAHLKQCEQMTLTRRQKRLCRREPGLAETLRESVRLSLLECRYQFRNERWNCSLDGRGSLLKRGKSFLTYSALRLTVLDLVYPPFKAAGAEFEPESITLRSFSCIHLSYMYLSQVRQVPSSDFFDSTTT